MKTHNPQNWSNAGPIRTIFKNAFAAAGLPYFNPHSFRKTLALLGRQEVQVAGRVQGVEPEPRPRKRPDDIFEPRRRFRAPTGADHPRAWHVRATCRIGSPIGVRRETHEYQLPVIDLLNPANSGKGYCHEGDPEDDEHLRERVLMIH